MMHRRELLLVGAGAIAAKATATAIACAADPVDPKAKPKTDEEGKKPESGDSKMDEHEGHEGHDMGAAGEGGDMSLVDALADCVAAGQACLAHCIRLLSTGDKSMGECATAVNDMLAICRASEALAANASKHLAAIAPLCIAACTDCAAACKPHIGHHAECKNCFAQCNKTIEAMKKL